VAPPGRSVRTADRPSLALPLFSTRTLRPALRSLARCLLRLHLRRASAVRRRSVCAPPPTSFFGRVEHVPAACCPESHRVVRAMRRLDPRPDQASAQIRRPARRLSGHRTRSGRAVATVGISQRPTASAIMNRSTRHWDRIQAELGFYKRCGCRPWRPHLAGAYGCVLEATPTDDTGNQVPL
jgi:hypothetical protein